MKINDEYIVKIDNVDLKGNGIARINNMVIFIKNALVDETLKIQIIELKKKYALAKIIEIIDSSKERCISKCPYYSKCGGCSFMHTTFTNEQLIKKENIIRMFPNVKVKTIKPNYEYGYRNKVIFHVENNKIGFYQEETNNLVEIDKCLLVDDKINNILLKIKNYDLFNITKVMIRKTYFTNEIMICFEGKLNDHDLIDILKIEHLKSLFFNDTLIYGSLYITDIINNIKYTIYKDAFFQINTLGMTLLYEKIKKYGEKGKSLLDLYCGTGTIGIYLHENFKSILGVEINSSAIKNAKLNKKLNKINNIDFICKDSLMIKDKYDVIVVDPPRNGLSKQVINNLLSICSSKIIYVSCNPQTLKRDIELLKEKYDLKELSIINMFPKTEHVECVCLLKQNN